MKSSHTPTMIITFTIGSDIILLPTQKHVRDTHNKTEIGFTITILLQKVLALLLIPYFWWSRIPKKIIPKIQDKILFCSATALAEKIRKKEITSSKIVQAYIDRIKVVNPFINAVVQERFEAALAEAKNCDNFVCTSGLPEEELKKNYPLLGIPLTVKESCSLKGMSYSVGSKNRLGLKASNDGDSVSRLRSAGAIPLLVSTTPELCLSWETTNLIQGRTCNPYDTSRTSGGSSGGEGSLLGCGASVIGLGSDVAGSIRVPAMFNGVFGHKPTPRVISIQGHYPSSSDDTLKSYLVVGPLTRYAEDLHLMTKVICDETIDLRLDEDVELSKMNVFFMEQIDSSKLIQPVDKDIKAAMQNAVNYLRDTSKMNIRDDKFNLKHTCEMCLTIFNQMRDFPSVLREPPNKKMKNVYRETVKSLFGSSEYSLNGLFFHLLNVTKVFIPESRYGYYKHKAECLKKDIMEKLGDNGVFLFPTYPTAASRHNKIFVETTSVNYPMLINILELPATNVPLGRNKLGLPIGIQVVAGPCQDRLCLRVAKELEKCYGGWSEP